MNIPKKEVNSPGQPQETFTNKEVEGKIQDIKTALRKFGTIKAVSLEIGLSQPETMRYLRREYGDISLPKIKRLLGIKKPLSQTKKNRILYAKKLYDELGTLEAVGKKMLITKERVRQLLTKGVDYGFFEYTLNRDKHYEELLKQFSHKRIIEVIKQFPSPSSAARILGVTVRELKRLMDYFSIDIHEHRLVAVKKRYISRYMKIVDKLGYDPVTTVMQKVPEWRATWAGITRIWGNMDNFRKEYGIKANFSRRIDHIMRVRPKNWNKKILERNLERKKQRKIELLALIQNHSPISHKQIKTLMRWATNAIYSYLDEMMSEGVIEKIGSGNLTKYQIKK